MDRPYSGMTNDELVAAIESAYSKANNCSGNYYSSRDDSAAVMLDHLKALCAEQLRRANYGN